jgi:hypothetical protein
LWRSRERRLRWRFIHRPRRDRPALFDRGSRQRTERSGIHLTLPQGTYSRTNHKTCTGKKTPSPHLSLKGTIYSNCPSVGCISRNEVEPSAASPTTFVSQAAFEIRLPPDPSRPDRPPFERVETPSSAQLDQARMHPACPSVGT